MKTAFLTLIGFAMGAAAPLVQAQEEAPAPAVAGQDAVQAAVRAYHELQMYRTYLASAEMLDDAAYDNDVVAGAQKLLEIAEGMPVDGLPESYKEYLQAKNARQAKSIRQIKEVMNGRTEEELTRKDLGALKRIMIEAEKELAEIEQKYPEASTAMGDEASSAFAKELDKELDLTEKAKQYMLEHPELAAGGQEAALSASMRHTAELILEHIESQKKK